LILECCWLGIFYYILIRMTKDEIKVQEYQSYLQNFIPRYFCKKPRELPYFFFIIFSLATIGIGIASLIFSWIPTDSPKLLILFISVLPMYIAGVTMNYEDETGKILALREDAESFDKNMVFFDKKYKQALYCCCSKVVSLVGWSIVVILSVSIIYALTSLIIGAIAGISATTIIIILLVLIYFRMGNRY